MIDVKEENDGTLTISWDENDPIESILNTWTEEDFLDCILQRCKEVLGEEEYNNILKNSEESGEESSDTIFIDQTAEEVQQDIETAQNFINKNNEGSQSRLFF